MKPDRMLSIRINTEIKEYLTYIADLEKVTVTELVLRYALEKIQDSGHDMPFDLTTAFNRAGTRWKK